MTKRPGENTPHTDADEGGEVGATTHHDGLSRRAFVSTVGGVAALTGLGLVGREQLPHIIGSAAKSQSSSSDLDPLALLQKMIQFDTQNFGDGGTTLTHAEWLKTVWDRAGVPAEIISTPKDGNVHLIARIPGKAGSSSKPLLLLGHSDVVPVERENWSVDPFAATIKDGQIYGRGALDMKGVNAASIAALLRHLSEGGEFDRDIIVLTDTDEEAGPHGSAWLAQQHWDKLDCGSVLTEGGWFLAQSDGVTPMLITVTRQDKVYFNIELTATGTATHSSKPMPDSSIVTLSRAVDTLGGWKAPAVLTDVTRAYFSALREATSDRQFARALTRLLKARDQRSLSRAAGLVVRFSDYPYLHDGLLRTTTAYVIEEAGYKENVIPSEARVRINCRGIPGGQKPRETLAQIRQVLAKNNVTVSLVTTDGQTEAEALAALDTRWATPPADLDTDLYAGVAGAAKAVYPDAVYSPALFEAGTSLGPWREKGIPGYGVYPYVIDNEQLIGMHGNDERIGVEALRQGTEFMYALFRRFRVS